MPSSSDSGTSPGASPPPEAGDDRCAHKVAGVQAWGGDPGGVESWARQAGESLFTGKGVGIPQRVLADYWAYLRDLTRSGVAPSAAVTTERSAGGLNQSGTATNTAAFGIWWNTQITALSKASGSKLKLLRLPGEATAKIPGAYLKPSMYWSISSRTRHAPEAALLADFLSNDDAAARALMTERGVPGNTKIRDGITDQLTATDRSAVEYLSSIKRGPAPRLTPKGASNDEAILKRHTEDVLFERATPDRAAAAFIKELQAEIDAA